MKIKKVQKRKVVLILIISIILFTIFIGTVVWVMQRNSRNIGLFSWEKSAVIEEEIFFENMKDLGITEVYQEMSVSLEEEDIKDFLEEARERTIDIYMLVGEAEWAVEEDAKGLIDAIDRLILINGNLKEEACIKGILVDVEPYLLDEWKHESDKIMHGYVEAMKKAYAYANKNGLKMILCIPYFYDIKGFDKELEELVALACDSIAVMNYYRDLEVSNIEKEISYAEKYGKTVVTIYEMKVAGTHGITEKNTYGHLGFCAVKENFKILQKTYKKQRIMMAYHDYEAVKEVLRNE